MFKKANSVTRSVVTTEDRRAVMLDTKSKMTELAKKGVKVEDHIRRALKARLHWPQAESAPEGVKAAAKLIAEALTKQVKADLDAKAALLAKKQAEEAEKKAAELEVEA